MNAPTDDTLDVPSRQTLEGVPARVLDFLMGVGKSLALRAALEQKGYGQDEHDYAWERLKLLGALPKPVAALHDKAVQEAVMELDQYDDKNFPPIKAALDRSFPAQSRFVFKDLSVQQGSASVVAVETLLDRLDQLESGQGRPKSEHKSDLAALSLLAKRGYPSEERARVRKLVATARTVNPAPETVSDEQRYKVLLELYWWLKDWSEQTKRSVTKKGLLIQAGLASRKKRKKKDEGTGSGGGAPPGGSVPA